MSFKSLNQQLPDSLLGTKIYRGTVIDNNDPLALDRVKARIPELYDPELGEVPWIIPIKSCLFGQGNGYGTFGTPPIGAEIVVGLQNNDANFPFYYGYFLTIPNRQLESEAPKYKPGVYGLIDKSGSNLTIDTNTNVLTYSHVSGVTFELKEGTLTITTTGNVNINVGKDANIKVNGNAVVNASSVSIKADSITNECNSFKVQASSIDLQGPTKTGPLSTPYGGGGANITGGIKNTGGVVSSNGIVLDSHTHGGVQPGPANTSGPN